MKPFIWGIVLATLFLSWGSEKYYTYWATTSKVNGSSEQPYKGIDFDSGMTWEKFGEQVL